MKQNLPSVLIVDDEPNVRLVLSTLCEQNGLAPSTAEDAAAALAQVRAINPDVILTDLQMPGMDGLDLLAELKRLFPEIPVVLLTAYGTVETAVEAMRRGAFDFHLKPFDKSRLIEVLRKAITHGARTRLDVIENDSNSAPLLLGHSAAMDRLRRTISKIAASPATVLIRGETGTGKELVAKSLHAESSRASQPMITVNCGALPESLLESELFGHVRGAFTGADQDRIGRIELAHGGTLFLDEIGELSLAAQVKLLRVLQEGEIHPVGSEDVRNVDVRVVAATHRDLGQDVASGAFREDLYFRLRVIQLEIPTLSERLEDILLLAEHFIRKHCSRLERPHKRLSETALAALETAAWPGNVRQLEHTLERAILLGEEPELSPADLGFERVEIPDDSMAGAVRAASHAVERRMICAALELTEGNVTHAATKLGLSRRGLQNKMKQFGLRDASDD